MVTSMRSWRLNFAVNVLVHKKFRTLETEGFPGMAPEKHQTTMESA
jgi:hypothetical protein